VCGLGLVAYFRGVSDVKNLERTLDYRVVADKG
jgi:hypothetical protein